MKCTCPTCEGVGDVIGKYVICEGFYAGVVAEGDTLEEVISAWTGGRSLRLRLLDGDIVGVSEEDYRRANELAQEARRRERGTTTSEDNSASDTDEDAAAASHGKRP